MDNRHPHVLRVDAPAAAPMDAGEADRMRSTVLNYTTAVVVALVVVVIVLLGVGACGAGERPLACLGI
jgi:hypothetical protein